MLRARVMDSRIDNVLINSGKTAIDRQLNLEDLAEKCF